MRADDNLTGRRCRNGEQIRGGGRVNAKSGHVMRASKKESNPAVQKDSLYNTKICAVL